VHFLHPLSHEAPGSNNQHPLHQPTQLQFTKDQTGFDGFAQADFISKQVSNSVAGDGTSECVQLVRKWNNARFERCQQHILG
jgi:hypothetical protein